MCETSLHLWDMNILTVLTAFHPALFATRSVLPLHPFPISPLHTPTCVRNNSFFFFFFFTCFLNQSSVYTEYHEAGAPVRMLVHKQEWIFKELRTTDSWSLQPMFYLCLHCSVLAAFDECWDETPDFLQTWTASHMPLTLNK